MTETTDNPVNRVCIIGCGNMGGACLSGWLSSEEGIAADLGESDFTVVAHSDASKQRIQDEYGVKCVTDLDELDDGRPFDLIVLAVKPQTFPDVLPKLSKSPVFDGAISGGKAPIVLSIAAGISTQSIEDQLPEGVHVVRAMPNMPLQVGHGATAVCGGAHATDEDVDAVNALFATLGTSNVTEERLIDAVCAISGGGPAYVAYMIEALRDVGVSLGLDSDLAESLALETVGGTYDSIVAKGLSPEEMRKSVCSPGGTTLAAMSELESAGFAPMFDRAMKAAVDRAAELREGA